jgi:hypothetical protein
MVGKGHVRGEAELTAMTAEIPATPEECDSDDGPHEPGRWLAAFDGVTRLASDGAMQSLDVWLKIQVSGVRATIVAGIGVAGSMSPVLVRAHR